MLSHGSRASLPVICIRPDMGDKAAHLIVKPSGKFCTTRQDLHAHRTGRRHDFTTFTDKARHVRHGPTLHWTAVAETFTT